MQARNDHHDDDCVGSSLGNLSRVLSRIPEIITETLNNIFTEFVDVKFYITPYFSEFWKAVSSRRP